MDCMRWNEEEFLRVYKGSATFVTEENRYYRLFLDLLKDEVLLSHIRFANDTLSALPLCKNAPAFLGAFWLVCITYLLSSSCKFR